MNSLFSRLSIFSLALVATVLPALAQQSWRPGLDRQGWWQNFLSSRGGSFNSGQSGNFWLADLRNRFPNWWNRPSGGSGGGGGGTGTHIPSGGGGGGGGPVVVPEIDASTGLLAIAAVFAALAFAWELRRRREQLPR